ncbi:ATP-binding protein, partial [bacterium]|nr:ATP-binding protein [bacterium]
MNFDDTTPYDILTEKWEPVLKHEALPQIEDTYKTKVTAVLLENQEQAIRTQRLTEDNTLGGVISNVATPSSSSIAGYDPILISLVRRAMPNLIAYDICGVQPMTAPTGLIFAMRPKYDAVNAPTPLRREALFQEPFVPFGGSGGTAGYGGYMNGLSYSDSYGLSLFQGTTGATKHSFYGDNFKGMLVGEAEGLGSAKQFNEMAFTIDKVAVQAKTRALKADYTTELAQDLKAVHGLDAETELANILST